MGHFEIKFYLSLMLPKTSQVCPMIETSKPIITYI